jgi:hypothetical protein
MGQQSRPNDQWIELKPPKSNLNGIFFCTCSKRRSFTYVRRSGTTFGEKLDIAPLLNHPTAFSALLPQAYDSAPRRTPKIGRPKSGREATFERARMSNAPAFFGC